MKHLFFAIMMLPFMVACSSSDNDIVTDVEGESETNAVNSNILGLTNMVFYLPEDGDTVTIPVGEDGWHIEEIIVNDSEGNAVYNMSAEEQNRLSEEGLYEGSFRDWLTIKCEKM